jgi:A-macroglobulin TED domain/Prenyltransferase and squalene oxidase repeat
VITILLLSLCLLFEVNPVQSAEALTQNDSIIAALNWLMLNQQSNGSYGSFTEPQTAPAAYAMWIRFQDTTKVLLSYNWLKNQLQNSSTWFWGGGGNIAEADIPGEILYTFSQSQNLRMLNLLSGVTANLTKFQQANGGFLGYFDTASNKQVTSSVDTAMALLGLISSNSITAPKEQSAVNYILSLQNPDGSFNLTKTLRSSSLYSLGPEPISITALVTLALKAASLSISNSTIVSALNYLTASASANFSGHVYAAALSLLAFSQFSSLGEVNIADSFILQQQNTDGGFRDTIRSSTGSNALDTGWATAALQLGGSTCCNGPSGGGRVYEM